MNEVFDFLPLNFNFFNVGKICKTTGIQWYLNLSLQFLKACPSQE